MSAIRNRRFATWAMVLLILVSLGYLAYAMAGELEKIGDALQDLNPWLLALSLLPFTAMYLAEASYHYLIVRQLGEAPGQALTVMSAYCQAQVVRYLPGKVWGLVYQSGKLRHAVNPQNVVIANVVQLLNTQIFTVWVCASIVLPQLTQRPHWLLLFPAGAAITAALHHSGLFERCAASLAARLTRVELPPHAPARGSGTAAAVGLLTFEWLAFFAGWVLVCDPKLSLGSMLVLGACYSVAALLASAAMVVPSGLAVREALFVSIGTQLQFDIEQLVLYGVIARLLLTGAEILCMLVISAIQRTARP